MFFLPRSSASLADRMINRVAVKPPYHASSAAESLHRKLFIADLHADTLLWNRDLLARASYGHVDLPRLQEGHIGLQVFGLVTRFPLFIKLQGNKPCPDVITWLALLQGWPKETRSSSFARAKYQCEKLWGWVRKSEGAFELITNQKELQALRAERDRGKNVIGVMLSLEGAHAVEGDLDNLDNLYDLGVRMVGLTHFFDNDVAGSAHGIDREGLSELGVELVRRAQTKGMLIDLAHASPQAIDDTLALVNKPVIVSHTGARGTCDTVRNLADRQIRGIAALGGVMGIGLFTFAVCGNRLADTVRAMGYVAELVGIEHVALGSDFDGAKAVVDASGLVLLTEAMLEYGFSESEISAILGGNVLRILGETLPDE